MLFAVLNPRLTYTTLLNVLDGPYASTTGCISIISCSNYLHFSEDKTSVDALLRPGRIAKQVSFEDTPKLEDMFCMMLGTTPAEILDKLEDMQELLESRPSQFEKEKSEVVKEYATRFARTWLEVFSPERATPKQPAVAFELVDVKNYCSQFFIGEAPLGEISAQQRRKLDAAVDRSTMLVRKPATHLSEHRPPEIPADLMYSRRRANSG